MTRKNLIFILSTILLTVSLSWLPAFAIDGDVEYSAPYIMVDPDTGQIVTVNPGPRLKAHEPMPSSEISVGMDENTPPAITGNAPDVNTAAPATILPKVVMIASLFMVVAGFFIWKSNQKSASNT